MSPSGKPEPSGASCEGCGSLLDLTDREISQAVEEVLESTLREAKELRGACPLCGRAPAPVPVSHRKSVQFALLAGLLIVAGILGVSYYQGRDTERREALRQAVEHLDADPHVGRLLGTPLTTSGPITGAVKTDETGWQEVSLSMPVRGPRAEGILTVHGGRQTGPWTFTTLEVVLPGLQQRLDALAHRVAELDPKAFVDAHTQPAATARYGDLNLPPARWDGGYPCVRAMAAPDSGPTIAWCGAALPHAAGSAGPGDRFEVDLRFGEFILRQDDLVLEEGRLRTPLTRTYASRLLIYPSEVHAFGRHSTHDFDAAPVGSRNPYTYLLLALPDGDVVYFGRISQGTGYADAVYRHTETSSRLYGAVIRWDGTGWETRLADGVMIHFPESYNARNLAQGAADEVRDAQGNVLRLVRDPQRNLREIRTPGGRSIRLTHDGTRRPRRGRPGPGDRLSLRERRAPRRGETCRWPGPPVHLCR
jgi:YD repeat-containing protein